MMRSDKRDKGYVVKLCEAPSKVLRLQTMLLIISIMATSTFGQAWTRHRGGAYGFATAQDSSHNVLVAGPSIGIPEDIVVCKYTPDGDLCWEFVYNTPPGERKHGYDIAVDASGRSYITGNVTLDGRMHMLNFCLDSDGQLLWDERFIDPDSMGCWGVKVALTPEGRLYIAARAFNSPAGPDITLFSMDTTGAMHWYARYDGPANGWDVPWDIVVDNTGHILVCGESDRPGNRDGVVVKFDSTGQILWVQRYEGPSNQGQLLGVRTDRYDNVYAAGSFERQGQQLNIITLKYDSAGNLLWAREFNGEANSYDFAPRLDVDREGNAYVWGMTWRNSLDRDLVMLKYSPTGETLWTRLMGFRNRGIAEARTIQVDTNGTARATAWFYDRPSGRSGWFTVMVCAEGEVLWSHEFDRDGHHSGSPNGLHVDGSGNIYVGGTFYGSQTLIKYANPMVGVAEPTRLLPTPSPTATILRAGRKLRSTGVATLVNVQGRKVAGLEPGDNLLLSLKPGVYYIIDQEVMTPHKVIVVE